MLLDIAHLCKTRPLTAVQLAIGIGSAVYAALNIAILFALGEFVLASVLGLVTALYAACMWLLASTVLSVTRTRRRRSDRRRQKGARSA